MICFGKCQILQIGQEKNVEPYNAWVQDCGNYNIGNTLELS